LHWQKMQLNTMSNHLIIREVGPRDGLQRNAPILLAKNKRAWIKAAYLAGIREMEVGSFMPTKMMPHFADTADMLAFAKSLPGLVASALVPNLRGAERALGANADLILLPMSASYSYSVKTVGKTPDEAVMELGRIRASRDASGKKALVECALGSAFGCSIQGEVRPSEVLLLVEDLLNAGADRISLSDSVSCADPASVRTLFEAALKLAGDKLVCGHFQDGRGLAMVNVAVAIELGIKRFDASLGGMGGCPFVENFCASLATEQLASQIHNMNLATGIDLPRLLDLRTKLASWKKETPSED
jgi:hydroxymethylglutaryl-CoA lyase